MINGAAMVMNMKSRTKNDHWNKRMNRSASDLNTHSEISAIPYDQPADIQTHVQYEEHEHRVMKGIGNEIQVIRIGSPRYTTDGIDQPGCLPEINDTPNAERPS